ncbi:MAG: hypothetical protein CMG80_17370 [Marinobacter sp.]|nr:hypothetical protein [Marinobacter sp.]
MVMYCSYNNIAFAHIHLSYIYLICKTVLYRYFRNFYYVFTITIKTLDIIIINNNILYFLY